MRIPGATIFTKQGVRPGSVPLHLTPRRAAILVIKDSTYAGTRAQRAYQAVHQALEAQAIISEKVEFLPNNPQMISSRISQLKQSRDIDLIITTGARLNSFEQDSKDKRASTDLWYDIRIPTS